MVGGKKYWPFFLEKWCARLAGFGHSRVLGLGFPTLREKGREAIKEAEGLHLGLLSSRDG
jgi:hypothetical protein